MERITTANGVTVSYVEYGSGPPLVLVHGGFSDHATNWQEVAPLLRDRFAVTAVARRGRGETSETAGHSVMDEAADVVAVLREIGEPVFLLGHSYGALCAMEAAALYPAGVRELVLYEAPNPAIASPAVVANLEAFAARADWDGMVQFFLNDVLLVPADEIAALRASAEGWEVWTSDAAASLHDLRAVVNHQFDANRFRRLEIPTLLLTGSESPRELYLTDPLAAVLPNARIHILEGQAHEGMTTAPDQFAETISDALLAAPIAA
jgi:pimeloyl-ACP methyl ester carboxylesterase